MDAWKEAVISLRIRRLKEGGYLATSPDVPGLVAQGRTVGETVEIAQDVARKIAEVCREHGDPLPRAFRKNWSSRVSITIAVSVP